MKKYLLFILLAIAAGAFTQTTSFDVFIDQPQEFFTKTELHLRIQWSLKDVTAQWNKEVVNHLSKATKKPGKILTQQRWDGWASTLTIGDFYQNKKKCIVLLYSFRKNIKNACAVYAFSDKIFKGPVEFSDIFI